MSAWWGVIQKVLLLPDIRFQILMFTVVSLLSLVNTTQSSAFGCLVIHCLCMLLLLALGDSSVLDKTFNNSDSVVHKGDYRRPIQSQLLRWIGDRTGRFWHRMRFPKTLASVDLIMVLKTMQITQCPLKFFFNLFIGSTVSKHWRFTFQNILSNRHWVWPFRKRPLMNCSIAP